MPRPPWVLVLPELAWPAGRLRRARADHQCLAGGPDLYVASAKPASRKCTRSCATRPEGSLKGILTYNEAPLVSIDYNHNPASSNFDATLTKVDGKLVKVCSWYDNEWGFSNRMLDTMLALSNAG